MSDFKIIETQEQFDAALEGHLKRERETVRKEFEGFLSPDDAAKKYAGYALHKFEEMRNGKSLYVSEKIARTEKSEARTVVRIATLEEQIRYEAKIEQKKLRNP